MSKPYTMIVDIDGKLDTILKKIFRDLPIISLNTIYKCIRTKQIKVNGKRARRDTPVHAGDELTIYNYMMIDALDDPDKVVAQQIARESYTHMIVYEDDHRIGRNKPVGVVMHSGTNHLHDITMNTYLADYAAAYATPLFTPAFCYRLDRDTSGILISAKTHDSLVMINDMIKKRTIEKLYCAVVVGAVNKSVTIDMPLRTGYNPAIYKSYAYTDPKQGKAASTTLLPIKTYDHDQLGKVTLIAARPKSGRMHQIRAHCAYNNTPVVGDMLYGNAAHTRIAKKVGYTYMLLHAYAYDFYDMIADTSIGCVADVGERFYPFFSDRYYEQLNSLRGV